MQIDQECFTNCYNISNDIIRVSALFENSDGVFVGEILEGVFSQLSPILQEYTVDDNDRKVLKDELENNIQLLAKAFVTHDSAGIYSSLRNIRYVTTKFQFKSWNTLSRKRSIKKIQKESE